MNARPAWLDDLVGRRIRVTNVDKPEHEPSLRHGGIYTVEAADLNSRALLTLTLVNCNAALVWSFGDRFDVESDAAGIWIRFVHPAPVEAE